jgi:nitroreductase
MGDMTLFEAIHTLRAIRTFKPDPVDDALIDQMLEAATRAGSGSNRQPWRFVVVKDQEIRSRLGALHDGIGDSAARSGSERTPWAQVPVLIVVCSDRGSGEPAMGPLAHAASILPAVQNLMLTARSLGIGTVLTTRWHARMEEIRAVLGLPETAAIHAVIPCGWPLDRFGPTNRRPVQDVAFRDRWGQVWQPDAASQPAN